MNKKSIIAFFLFVVIFIATSGCVPALYTQHSDRQSKKDTSIVSISMPDTASKELLLTKLDTTRKNISTELQSG